MRGNNTDCFETLGSLFFFFFFFLFFFIFSFFIKSRKRQGQATGTTSVSRSALNYTLELVEAFGLQTNFAWAVDAPPDLAVRTAFFCVTMVFFAVGLEGVAYRTRAPMARMSLSAIQCACWAANTSFICSVRSGLRMEQRRMNFCASGPMPPNVDITNGTS